MRDRPRDDEPPDQPPERGRPSEGDRPERRTDRPDVPEQPPKDYQPDRRKLTPLQREYVQKATGGPPEFAGDVPHAIDWKTGEPTGEQPPRIEVDDTADGDTAHGADRAASDAPDGEFGDVGSVHDPLDATRPKDQTGGLQGFIDERDQAALEATAPKDADGNFEKFPDPDGEWTDYVNDGGPEVDHFRGNNCLDCSIAALATWYGHPTVAAPRFPDRTPDGRVDIFGGEHGGPNRAQEWTGGQYESCGSGDAGFAAIEEKLREGGHGSAAALVTSWRGTKFSHAWNAFNHNDKIIWYDPQRSITDDKPVYRGPRVGSVRAICLDAEGKQL